MEGRVGRHLWNLWGFEGGARGFEMNGENDVEIKNRATNIEFSLMWEQWCGIIKVNVELI